MKKLYFLIAATMLSSGMAMAQTNLALGGTATSPKGDAAAAIDDNNGTRWEFGAGDITNETDAVWNLDLGTSQEFNTIQILWETACSEEFNIYASDDAENFGEPVLHVTGNTAELQTYKLDKAVTARYIKFENVKRGTQWGVSFFEFRVFKMDAATLTSIELTADQTTVKVGTPVVLTVAGKDQLGGDMEAGEVTYTVIPAEAGNVVDGVYTPAQGGTATIVAEANDIKSNEVKVTAYAGEKIDIFTNMASMVSPIGEETTTGSMVGAFDDNMASVWEMHAGTAADEAARTYETGFVIDLQATYDITALSIMFEGACPADYTVSFAGNDGVYGNEHAVKDHAGMNAFTDFFLSEAKDVRYIKFLSTKAATQYGIKMYDFSVYGEKKADLEDNAAPTELTATVAGASFSSVTLKLQATDDVSSVISYEISYDDKKVNASGASGAETTCAVTGLEAGKEYTFSVVAKDGKGNATEAVEVKATTKTLVAAPVPTMDAANVINIYSDEYIPAEGLNTNPDWGQATVNTPIQIGEDYALMLSNLNYQGIEFNVIDATEMETLHVDVYPETATAVTIVPIWRNVETNANYAEVAYKAENLTPGEWNSLDIPMTAFASDDRNGTNNLYQIKIDNGNGNTFIFDNIYLYKSGVADEVAPVFAEGYPKAEAALNTVTVTVKGSDETKSQVTFIVTCGETTKKVAAANDEEATVAFEGLEAGEYTFSVTVSDGKNTSETKEVKATVKAITKIELSAGAVTVDENVNAVDIEKAFDGIKDKEHKWQMLGDGKGNLEEGFTVDLKGEYTVDAVSVAFMDAGSTKYTVELLDAEKNVVAAKTVDGLTAALGEITESTEAVAGEKVRYVKFTSLGSTTPDWGVHIAEFTVYGTKTADVALVATTLEVTADVIEVKVGETITLTATVKDQYGEEMSDVEVTYTVENGLGTIENNVFTATTAGTGNIIASVEGCEDAVIAITVEQADGISGIYAGDSTDAVMYNLAGQRVNNTTKGIVIVNGKKIFRK